MEERKCFIPECESTGLSSQKKLYPFLIDANDINSWIVGVGSSQLTNNVPDDNKRICEQYFLCTDHLNFLNSLESAENNEGTEGQDDEEDSSNRLSQQLSTLSVSKAKPLENVLDDLDVAEFVDILASQKSEEFDELMNSLEELSQKKNYAENVGDICRVCGNKSTETLSIFPDKKENEDLKDISLLEKLQFYLPIKIEDNDNFPKVICTKCNELLDKSHELAMMALMTESHLMDKIPGDKFSTKKIEASNVVQETKENGEAQKKSDGESDSQDSLTDGETIKPSISSLMTDDEDQEPFTRFEDLKSAKDDGKKRSLPQYPVNDARPMKIRRVEPSFEKRLECNLCSASYTDEGEMNFHKHRHRLKKPVLFWCNSCHSEFIKKSTLMKHIMSKHRQQYHIFSECYKCKKCGEIFPLSSYARNHFITDCASHPIDDYCALIEKYIEDVYIKHTYTCEFCYKSFAIIMSLHEHRNKHHFVDTSCKNCDKHKTSYKEKETETLNNFGIKNSFVCRYCTKIFKHYNLYIYHQQEHSDRLFCCSMCEKKFCAWNDIKEHRESEHFYQIIYREKTAKFCVCFCGIEFDEEEQFMIHEKSHFMGTTLYEACGNKTMAQQMDFLNSVSAFLENMNSPHNSIHVLDN